MPKTAFWESFKLVVFINVTGFLSKMSPPVVERETLYSEVTLEGRFPPLMGSRVTVPYQLDWSPSASLFKRPKNPRPLTPLLKVCSFLDLGKQMVETQSKGCQRVLSQVRSGVKISRLRSQMPQSSALDLTEISWVAGLSNLHPPLVQRGVFQVRVDVLSKLSQ